MKTICLCMILKNEGHIIERCLNSVKDIIDTYVICDTGSTDDTKEKIKNFFDSYNISGVILDHKWVNFSVNRNMLLQASKNKADYLLLVDADYVINVYDTDFKKYLNQDGYLLGWEGNLDYKNVKLIRGDLEWKYFCPTHEYLRCMDRDAKCIPINSISITEHYDGGCRDNKFKRDIDLLLNEIAINPTDPDIPRYYFYLARSHEDLKDYDNALVYYKKRIECGGFMEEVYFSKYKYGECKMMLKKPFEEISEALLEAYNYRPSRLEALYHLITYCLNNKFYNMGYIFGKNAVKTPYPENDILFIDKPIHTYLFKLNYSLCAYHIEKYDDALSCSMELLQSNIMPDNIKYTVIKNILYYLEKTKNNNYDVNLICDILIDLYRKTKDIQKYCNEILVFCRNNKIHDICYFFGEKLLGEYLSDEYIIKVKDEMAISSYYIGKYKESIDLCDDLLSYQLNEQDKKRISVNKDFSKKVLGIY